ncbi:MAG: hypothetical protein AABY22_00530 [Nanoarchaeota archaeon]|mgnify:CR=1 FL=1
MGFDLESEEVEDEKIMDEEKEDKDDLSGYDDDIDEKIERDEFDSEE